MAVKFKITKRHSENYKSQMDVKGIGSVWFLINYELETGYWKPRIDQEEHKLEGLHLKIRRGKGIEEIFKAYTSYEGKVMTSSEDYLCAGPLEPRAIHYDIVRFLKKKQIPLSPETQSFLEQAIRDYFAKLRESSITKQIIEHKKNRKKYK